MDLDQYLQGEEGSKELQKAIQQDKVNALQDKTIVIKYGGNAMKDSTLKEGVMKEVALLKGLGAAPVIVHGGGPFIQQLLDEVNLPSEFIGGHRKTTEEAMKYVEMALKGKVNGDLVRNLIRWGCAAVGLSGKDAGMVRSRKRLYEEKKEGKTEQVDLGRVGDVDKVDPSLLSDLVTKHYVPVVAPITLGTDHKDMNVNADMFAGHIAGALKAEAFIALTDVDGLMKDKDDPATLLTSLSLKETEDLYGETIQGGMIPKVDACRIAVEHGVKSAHIINGTKPYSILRELITGTRSGTMIRS